ncbi:MAG: HDOD domain-containing protein [Calditrichia bacterium]
MKTEARQKKLLSPELAQRRVRRISKLSTLPFIAVKVMELVENPRTSASKLCDFISADQVMAARILRLANSAYYGFPRKISTLNLAIVVLGFNALRDLVLSISIIDRFSLKSQEEIDLEQFWRHALIVGRGARVLARYLNYPVVGEAFVAGLLHDIGYLAFMQQFPTEFKEVNHFSRENATPFNEAEIRILGYSHTQLGSWLAENWNLPAKLVEAIRYHHQPDKSMEHQEMVKIIHMADLISYSIGEGSGINQIYSLSAEELETQLKEKFSKNVYPLSFLQDKFRQESEKIQEFLDILQNKKQ